MQFHHKSWSMNLRNAGEPLPSLCRGRDWQQLTVIVYHSEIYVLHTPRHCASQNTFTWSVWYVPQWINYVLDVKNRNKITFVVLFKCPSTWNSTKTNVTSLNTVYSTFNPLLPEAYLLPHPLLSLTKLHLQVLLKFSQLAGVHVLCPVSLTEPVRHWSSRCPKGNGKFNRMVRSYYPQVIDPVYDRETCPEHSTNFENISSLQSPDIPKGVLVKEFLV